MEYYAIDAKICDEIFRGSIKLQVYEGDILK